MWQYLQTVLEALGYIFAVIGLGASIYGANKAWRSTSRLSWDDMENQTKKLMKRIAKDNYQPDIVVTIGRGGAVVGAIISGNLPAPYGKKTRNISLLGVDRLYRWEDGNRIEVENKLVDFRPLKDLKVLLVAGDVLTGGTMRFFSSQIEAVGVSELRTACLLKGLTGTFNPDYFGKEIPADFETPWMYRGYNYARDSRHPANYVEPTRREKWSNRFG